LAGFCRVDRLAQGLLWLRRMPRLRQLAPLLIAAAVVVVAGLGALVSRHTGGFLQRLEWMAYDWRVRQAFRDTALTAENLGFVYIDDDSLAAINRDRGHHWPWPRHLHGELVRQLHAGGAKAVGFDIRFSELHHAPGGRVSDSDEAFARDLRAAGNVALGAMGVYSNAAWHALLPAELFRTNAWATAHINSERDADGILRRVPVFLDDPQHGRLWQMAVVLAARELGLDLARAVVEPGRITLPGTNGVSRVLPVEDGQFLHVDWSLSATDGRLTADSFERVLHPPAANPNSPPPPDWRGRLVVVGSIGSGNNISDIGSTPLSGNTYLVSNQWNVLNSLLTGRFIQRLGLGGELVIIVLLTLASLACSWKPRVAYAAAGTVLVGAVWFISATVIYSQARWWLPVASPLAALGLTFIGVTAWRVVVEQGERRRVKAVFRKIVAPEVVDELLRAEKLQLGGESRLATVYFADVRGFTELTNLRHIAAELEVERLGLTGEAAQAVLNRHAAEMLETVNLYLSTVADTIKDHGGTLDKYIGDCVMSFWGAPVPDPCHAARAVQAAVDAQRAIHRLNQQRDAQNQRLVEENQLRRASGQPELRLLPLLSLGSGLNTGMVVVGLMGSEKHIVNYTVFGRDVNLASRLEGTSGKGRVIIGEATFRALQEQDAALAATCVKLAPVKLKGIDDYVTSYEVPWRQDADKDLSTLNETSFFTRADADTDQPTLTVTNQPPTPRAKP
jgi:adenylate cyclase